MIAELIIKTLTVSILWVITYTNLLSYLNNILPPTVPDIQFIRSSYELAPEQHEIPLYLALTFVTVLLCFIFSRIKSRILEFLPRYVKYFSIIFLTLFFAYLLGSFPLAHEIPPYQNPIPQEIQLAIVLVYLTVCGLLLLQIQLFRNIITQTGRSFAVFSLLLCIFLAVILFEPQMPSFALDYSLFYGPIWEIVHGKTIYTQIPSLYGFLSVFGLAIGYKVGMLNLWYLPFAVFALYVFEYYLGFFLIYKVSRSVFYGFLGLCSIFTLNYFVLFHMGASIPQTGPLRFLPFVIAIVSLYFSKNLTSRKFIITVAVLSFWNIDVGISLLLSYIFSMVLAFFVGHLTLRAVISALLWFIFVLVIIVFAVQSIHILLGYEFINPAIAFEKLSEYSRAGFGMWPVGERSFLWFVLAVYFASLLYIFKKNKNSLRTNDVILLFTAQCSFFSSVYFVGRSHPHNFFHISFLFLLNVFLLIGIIMAYVKSRRVRVVTAILIFSLFIALPVFQRQEAVADMILKKINRFARGGLFEPENRRKFREKYSQEIPLIRSHMVNKKIVILSDDDTYLYMLSDKENLMNFNPQTLNFKIADFDQSLTDVYKVCPEKIVGDCRLFGKCITSSPIVETNLFIQPLMLERIQKKCDVLYRATFCTKHLCIAENSKQ